MSIMRRLSLAVLPLLCLLTRTVAQDTAVQIRALQPEVQTAPWAVKWWMPRHQQKLNELDALKKVDLLMNFSLQQYLKAEPWDYVTLQQMSALSYKPESFHPHIERLSAIVKEHAPDAKILIHQTWAYRPDSPLLEKDNLSQQAMYERLDQAYAAVAKKLGSRIIPVGTAFQSVREVEGREVLVGDPDFDFENPVYPNLPRQTNSLVVGWHWTKRDGKPRLVLDYKHGNTQGCFLAGLVWYEALTGNDARETSFVPQGVDQREAAFYRQIAHLTVAGPRPVAARINRN